MRVRGGTIVLFAAMATTGAGCAKKDAPPSGTEPASASAAPLGDCRTRFPGPALKPVGDASQSGTVALAELEGRKLAIVADEDTRALLTIDVERRVEIASTPLDGTPSQLLITADGRVLVGLRDRAKLAVLERGVDPSGKLSRRCDVDVATEPVALAVTPDEKTILVSSGWAHTLTGFEAATLEKAFELDVPREPRAVVVASDGRHAFVAHAVGGGLSAIDLADARRPRDAKEQGASASIERVELAHTPPLSKGFGPPPSKLTSCQGYALARVHAPGARVLAPAVAVDSGNRAKRSSGYGDESGKPAEQPTIAVVDEDTKTPLADSLLGVPTQTSRLGECLLPRAAAVDPVTHTLLVACYGIDAVIAYDALAPTPASAPLRRYAVGGGPSGIAVDPATGRAWVWSQFDRTLTVLPVRDVDPVAELRAGAAPVERVAIAPVQASVDSYRVAIGRQLFHAVNDARISADGRACASCHPDGRDDALTWSTPDGPRRTAMLAGRLAGTGPYGWTGASPDLREHVAHTFERLSGTGVSSLELDALLAYVQSLDPPRAPAARSEATARGNAIFHSAQAGCWKCHRDEAAFADGRRHNVASRAAADSFSEFDTPSLRFVGARAPYFHDGRYSTLSSLLKATSSTMGNTEHLTEPDLADLEAYLRSL